MRIAFRWLWILHGALLCAPGFSAAPAGTQAQAPAPSNDMIILDQEAKFQTEKTQYLQQNILDKILGVGKAVVIVDVEMGLEAKNMTMDMGKSKSDKKKNENDDEKGPAPADEVFNLGQGLVQIGAWPGPLLTVQSGFGSNLAFDTVEHGKEFVFGELGLEQLA